METQQILAVLAATVASFVLSAAYYGALADQLVAARGGVADGEQPSTAPWKMAVEVLRGLVLAVVLAEVLDRAGVAGVPGALGVGLLLWVGFPVVLWSGALLWEATRPGFAALHAGDWLLKLLVLPTVLVLVA